MELFSVEFSETRITPYRNGKDRQIKLNYLGKTGKNQNWIHMEIKNQIKFGECLLTSEQNVLSGNVKIKVYKFTILPALELG